MSPGTIARGEEELQHRALLSSVSCTNVGLQKAQRQRYRQPCLPGPCRQTAVSTLGGWRPQAPFSPTSGHPLSRDALFLLDPGASQNSWHQTRGTRIAEGSTGPGCCLIINPQGRISGANRGAQAGSPSTCWGSVLRNPCAECLVVSLWHCWEMVKPPGVRPRGVLRCTGSLGQDDSKFEPNLCNLAI